MKDDTYPPAAAQKQSVKDHAEWRKLWKSENQRNGNHFPNCEK